MAQRYITNDAQFQLQSLIDPSLLRGTLGAASHTAVWTGGGPAGLLICLDCLGKFEYVENFKM